MSKRHTYYY